MCRNSVRKTTMEDRGTIGVVNAKFTFITFIVQAPTVATEAKLLSSYLAVKMKMSTSEIFEAILSASSNRFWSQVSSSLALWRQIVFFESILLFSAVTSEHGSPSWLLNVFLQCNNSKLICLLRDCARHTTSSPSDFLFSGFYGSEIKSCLFSDFVIFWIWYIPLLPWNGRRCLRRRKRNRCMASNWRDFHFFEMTWPHGYTSDIWIFPKGSVSSRLLSFFSVVESSNLRVSRNQLKKITVDAENLCILMIFAVKHCFHNIRSLLGTNFISNFYHFGYSFPLLLFAKHLRLLRSAGLKKHKNWWVQNLLFLSQRTHPEALSF